MPVFLFTDIEGSTRLWEEHTRAMGAVIARHDAILREVVSECRGWITKHTGDGITSVFDDGDPIRCALEAQVRFAAEPWGAIGELRIRVGLHAGQAELHGGDYFGPPVNCTARIMSAAWGGQILLTPEVTRVSPLPEQAALLELGEHLLKDVSTPQQLYQLLHPDLPRKEFPPPRTLSGQSIRRLVDEQGGRLADLAPPAMASALVSATLLPAVVGEPSRRWPALACNVGVLHDLGAVTLADFLEELAGQVEGAEPGDIRQHLEAALQRRWVGEEATALALRADSSRLLQAVQGVDVILTAASGEVKEALVRGLADLGGQFGEFRWMLGEVRQTLAEVRGQQALQLTLQQEQLDLQRQQLEQTELLLALQQEQVQLLRSVDAWEPVLEPRLPAFVAEDAQDVGERPVFVARERELARLDRWLEGALAGQGQVIFVTGGPGRGKTALLTEFARRAMEAHPDLLVAQGGCDAYAGVGDAYLPWREVLSMLTGEVEAGWAAGAIGCDQARRLWAAMPHAFQALLGHGPQVVSALLPGEAALVRASAACPDASWLGRLKERIQWGSERAEGLEQIHLFQQVNRVLRAVAEEHPLLLIVDDLQWADAASIGLLFHAGRRLEGARILIAGAYRPAELSAGREGERHPLEKVLAEFKRVQGDVWLDLAEVREADSRHFVDAYLETEPNRLGEGFREALHRQAGGNPLFTIELLRAMQGRGDLVRDEDGRWVETAALDWETLPARVEGAIAERVDRLREELHQILTVASVEGEEFTAEMVGEVLGMDPRMVVRRLSEELQKEHRLVSAHGLRQTPWGRLALYRFRHHLFQRYLYQGLDQARRAYLHKDVGQTLETLYGERADEVAVQLARHFLEAGVVGKAAFYLRRAGEQAAARYANEEALLHLSKALELVPVSDLTERFGLYLARERVHEILGQRGAQWQDLADLEVLAERLDGEQQAEVAARQAAYALITGDFAGALAKAEAAITLGQEVGNAGVQAWGQRWLGATLVRQGDYAGAQPHFEAMLSLARSAGLRDLEAWALQWLGITSDDLAEEKDYLEQALSLFEEAGDRMYVAAMMNSLGMNACKQGDYATSWARFSEFLQSAIELGHRELEELAWCNWGRLCSLLGDHGQAQEYIEQSLRISREIEAPYCECRALSALGMVNQCWGHYDQARRYLEEALRLAREIGARELEWETLHYLGSIDMDLGNFEAAKAAHEEEFALLKEMLSLAGLAGAALALGELDEAQSLVAEILAELDAGETPSGFLKPMWVYLICYRVLEADSDPRAREILAAGYRLLIENADRTPDETMRRSYLENVPWNREILELAKNAALTRAPEDAPMREEV